MTDQKRINALEQAVLELGKRVRGLEGLRLLSEKRGKRKKKVSTLIPKKRTQGQYLLELRQQSTS